MRPLLGILRLGLALLFLYAGVAKLGDTRLFAADIANYRVLPATLVAPFAVTLPGVEIACGLGLLVAPTMRAAAVLASAMLATFTIAAAQALARDINIDCGCFGNARAPVTVLTVVRDLAVLEAALAVAWLAPRASRSAVPPRT
jgi:uncharacterized membrane protein YphA (DoxX/SURF4 family)